MALIDKLRTAPVKELHLRSALCVEPNQKISAVIEAMRQANLGCAIVVDGENKLVGMFTEGIVRDQIAANPGFIEDRVAEHMASTFPRVKLDDTVDLVLDAMHANNTRFLCVVDDDGCVRGLTGQKGLMEFIAEHYPRQVMVQYVGGPKLPDQREGA